MSKVNSVFEESLAANSALETNLTLLSQLDQLERRNNLQKRNAQVRDRAKAVEVCLQKCRQLIGNDDASAALLYLKCLSLIEETDRILNGGRNSVMSNTNSSHVSSSLNRIQPTELQNLHASNVQSQKTNAWNNPIVQILPDQIETNGRDDEQDDKYQYNYYGYNKSKWWRILCMNSSKEAKEKDSDVRDLWNTQIEFFLSCLGFIVGVGNTLRFPAMMYRYGGIFFVPYTISLAIFGLPLVYLHLCIGQYSGLSASGAFWKLMPVASGIGWALVLLAVPVAIYYNIIVAWGLYYSWFSLQGIFVESLPWNHCNPAWNKSISPWRCCELNPESIRSQNFTACYFNEYAMSSPEAFFHYQVLNRSSYIHPTFGDIQFQMLVSLAFAWILVFFGVFKGIGSIGWAVSITSTIPYLMLIVLLLRGLSMEGASVGLRHFFSFDVGDLWDIQIWRCAAQQVFYELGIDAGPLISMASFSRYRNNIYRDAVLLVLIDMITSILCGLVIFSFLGFLAHQQGTDDIKQGLIHEPLYLAFTVYPGVTSFMELNYLWSALFFGMLTLSALDAEFAWLEMIASSIMNQLGSKHKSVENRLLIGLCLFFFICGIPLCAQGGLFIFHSIENLNANWNSFSVSLLIIIVVIKYGVDEFLDNIGEMLRVEKPPSQWLVPGKSRWYALTKRVKYFFGPTGGYIKFSWYVFAPFILIILFVTSIYEIKRVSFNGVALPIWYEAVAWVAMIGPLFVIPFTVIYTIYETWKRKKPLSSIFSGKNWKNKEVKEEEHKIVDKEDDYMYIDPISRGASAKSRIVSQINHQPTNEDNYTQSRDRIREWAAISARNDPIRNNDVPSNVTTSEYETYEMDQIRDDGDLYGRRTGRIRDLVLKEADEHAEDNENSEKTSSSSEIYAAESERRSTVKRSPFSKSTAVDIIEEPTLTLFGPPPVQQPPDIFAQSMSRIKKRDQRRSDQRKNRAFNNSFNLIVMQQPNDLRASTSTDRMPSPAVPDRPNIRERRIKIGPRKSTESGTNISLAPFNIAPSTSNDSINDSQESFPLSLAVPTLKRPKPIDNIPTKNNESPL